MVSYISLRKNMFHFRQTPPPAAEVKLYCKKREQKACGHKGRLGGVWGVFGKRPDFLRVFSFPNAVTLFLVYPVLIVVLQQNPNLQREIWLNTNSDFNFIFLNQNKKLPEIRLPQNSCLVVFHESVLRSLFHPISASFRKKLFVVFQANVVGQHMPRHHICEIFYTSTLSNFEN